jgi:hypothetical protein
MTEPGRRSHSRRSRLNPTALIGVVLVALTLLALLTVSPAEPSDRTQPPAERPLTSATVGCPSALDDESVYVASGLKSVSGEVELSSPTAQRSVDINGDEVNRVNDVPDPVALSASGEQAPGLLASRFGDDGLAAVDCPVPSPDTWFTGAGAGADHNSVVELVNPDEGLAVADITALGRTGTLDAPELRGVSVPGNDSVRLDLGEVLPRRGDLALRIVVSRGRLATSVLDVVPEVGARPETSDWLPPSGHPAEQSVLLGLPRGEGDHVLAVANPGTDEARASLRVLTPDSAFTPEGLDELRVPPGGVRTVTLSSELEQAVTDGAIGLAVTGTVPVTATLRSVVDEDISHAVPVTASAEPMTALLPTGDASVVIADADAVGTVTVTSFAPNGRRLGEETVEVRPGTGGTVDLPGNAALVRVSSARTAVHAAALITDGRAGAAVVPFRELVTTALVPDVRPGLP